MSGQGECERAAGEVGRALRERRPEAVAAETREHIATCARCRVALLTTVGALDPALLERASSIACDTCLADLPAFLDLEEQAPAQAVAQYPHVWWHLLTCATCAETYAISRALLDDPLLPQLSAPEPRQPAWQALGTLLKRIQIPRPSLTRALLAEEGAFGVRRGADAGPLVVYDDFDDQRSPQQITVALEEDARGASTFVVAVQPPLAGQVRLVCGPLELAAPLQGDGTAVLRQLSPGLTRRDDGPDVEIHIYADA